MLLAVLAVAFISASMMAVASAMLLKRSVREAIVASAHSLAASVLVSLETDGISAETAKKNPKLLAQMQRDLKNLQSYFATLNKDEKIETPWALVGVMVENAGKWNFLALTKVDDGPMHEVNTDLTVQALSEQHSNSLDRPQEGWYKTELGTWFGVSLPFTDHSGVVVVVIRNHNIYEYLLQTAELALAALGASVVIAVFLGHRTAIVILKPIDQIREFTQQLNKGNFHAALTPSGSPEIRQRMRELKNMANGLAQRERLTSEVKKQTRRMLDVEASEVDFSELGLDMFLLRMVKNVVQKTNCECVALLLREEDETVVRYTNSVSNLTLQGELMGCRMTDSHSVVTENLKCAVFQVERADAIALAPLQQPPFAHRPVLISTMVSDTGRPLGVLLAINPIETDSLPREKFSDTDQATFRHYATLITISLERKLKLDEMIEMMLHLVEMHDPRETYPHVKRVSSVGLELFNGWAINHGLREQESVAARKRFLQALMLHDVGKIGISNNILTKPGKLTDQEYTKMKYHSVLGAMYSLDEDAREVAMHHHERWDGNGYPGPVNIAAAKGDIVTLLAMPLMPGLSGSDIPFFARIVAIADVFDALSSARCYKDAWPESKVLETIRTESGKAFDPELVDIFFERYDRIKAEWAKYPDKPPTPAA